MRNHLATLSHLAFVERRSVDRDEHLRAELDQLVGRIIRVEPFTPERLIVPEVLADRDADPPIAYLEQVEFFRWLEVARVVKHVILRQQGLVREPEQLPVSNHRRRVK